MLKRSSARQSQRHCVVVPQIVHLVTRGRGVPGGEYPRKCFTCRQPIGAGESWQANHNGEYVVIQHTACIGARSVLG